MKKYDNSNKIIRYEVTVSSGKSETIDAFILWVGEEHGEDLLNCQGCFEFRVLRVSSNQAKAEYLFKNQKALDEYFKTAAPKLRKKSLERFKGKDIRFERSSSVLELQGGR